MTKSFFSNKSQFFVRSGFLLVILYISSCSIHKIHFAEYDNWRAVLRSDAAGYYVYLPATFIYGFDAAKIPSEIFENCGKGFSKSADNKVVTKFYYGTSLMELPFFAVNHVINIIRGRPHTGFEPSYHKTIYISASFWLICGLLFLYHFLKKHFNSWVAALSSVAVVLGSNLFYYGVYGAGMSHVYSFATLSMFLWFFSQWLDDPLKSIKKTILWSFFAVLLIMIRPTNALLLLFVFFLRISSAKEFSNRIRQLFRARIVIPFLVVFALLVFPQLLYYKYAFGHFFSWAYQNESFIYWNHPYIFAVLFSAKNGLFMYAPIAFLSITGLMVGIKYKRWEALGILFIFITIIYLSASWHSIYFGECSFGARNFAESFALLSIPLATLLERVSNKVIRILVLPLVIVFVLLTQKLSYSFDYCFQGKDFDYNEYVSLLKTHSFSRRFKQNTVVIDGKKADLIKNEEYYYTSHFIQSDKSKTNFRKIEIRADVRTFHPNPSVSLAVMMKKDQKTIHWGGFDFADFELSPLKWQRIYKTLYLPPKSSLNSDLSVFIWNHNDSIAIRKLKYRFK